ncbi:forkhead box protein D1-like [Sycon ciliatum]|uniref:forkhead box protein D1-like n=1 Tax=Sycon ciliatum TaxID=27933 RepID=UPI0031F6AA55
MVDSHCDGPSAAAASTGMPALIPMPQQQQAMPAQVSTSASSTLGYPFIPLAVRYDSDAEVSMIATSQQQEVYEYEQASSEANLQRSSSNNTPSSLRSNASAPVYPSYDASTLSTEQMSVGDESEEHEQPMSEFHFAPHTNIGKPKQSFIAMIFMAIRASPKQRASLSQIYEFVSKNFPYYDEREVRTGKAAAKGNWKNSVRHNLSLNACFVREGRKPDDPGKGSYWKIDTEYSDLYKDGYCERRKVRVKKTPRRPRVPRKQHNLITSTSNGSYQMPPLFNQRDHLSIQPSVAPMQNAGSNQRQVSQQYSSSSTSTPLTPPVSPDLAIRSHTATTSTPSPAIITASPPQPSTAAVQPQVFTYHHTAAAPAHTAFQTGGVLSGPPVPVTASGSPFSVASLLSNGSAAASGCAGPAPMPAVSVGGSPAITFFRVVPAGAMVAAPQWPGYAAAPPAPMPAQPVQMPITYFTPAVSMPSHQQPSAM